jgi:NADPH:quinone reductase-like Zn-dependent oxidoreductase
VTTGSSGDGTPSPHFQLRSDMTAPVHRSTRRTFQDDVPSSQRIGATDAVVRVDTGTPCGTELHLLKGVPPTVPDARAPTHEAVGTVIEVGSPAATVHIGDRLLVTCSSTRGHTRTLLHRCRLVADAAGQSSHPTSSAPAWTGPLRTTPHHDAGPVETTEHGPATAPPVLL